MATRVPVRPTPAHIQTYAPMRPDEATGTATGKREKRKRTRTAVHKEVGLEVRVVGLGLVQHRLLFLEMTHEAVEIIDVGRAAEVTPAWSGWSKGEKMMLQGGWKSDQASDCTTCTHKTQNSKYRT